MLNHPVTISSGLCALCGFITSNLLILGVAIVIMLLTWMVALLKILVNCHHSKKRLQLLHERRLRRAHTVPAT